MNIILLDRVQLNNECIFQKLSKECLIVLTQPHILPRTYLHIQEFNQWHSNIKQKLIKQMLTKERASLSAINSRC